ncbi:MAG: hypothetical protein H0X50_08045 [Nitrosopumilus sp.]|nr:hypothetical protein [Nitrosopumilus sp.]
MILITRPSLTLFCMALSLTIGLTLLNSESLSQNNAFALDDEIVDEIREQCGLNELPQVADLSDILESCIRDSPYQIPISEPIALIFIKAALIFIPPLN